MYFDPYSLGCSHDILHTGTFSVFMKSSCFHMLSILKSRLQIILTPKVIHSLVLTCILKVCPIL